MTDTPTEPSTTPTADLAAAYQRLLFAYPSRYRRERGPELVDLYLEMAGDRRSPGFADTADLIRGGLRERLRTIGLGGLADGVSAAGVLALATLGALAVYFLSTVEVQHLWPNATQVNLPLGPFRTPAALAYLACLMAVLAFAARPGRFARVVAVVALLLVTAVLLVRATVGIPVVSMPGYLLLPLVALALLALAAPSTPSWPVRLLPLAAAVATFLAGGAHLPLTSLAVGVDEPVGNVWDTTTWGYRFCCGYITPTMYILHLIALALLTAAVLLALRDAGAGRARGAWTLLILLTPMTLMEAMRLNDIAPFSTISRLVGSHDYERQVVIAGLLGVLITGVLLPLATGQAVRLARHRKRILD
ncbi:hypothetical protein [Actinoplanes awajinensis]|uniref:Uncharacterized protein n=1 Tax=Actinoplanes awajinensis subsp. mycoplanecinus TaxID=135947 RepID=A0A117MPW7_9ACTN|nr:hypothetical protein [Actinoplanes awajinensis]KUL29214.1 hypothetical protein ADL15_29085 [Actinoplanes awajinensis subsp. mycoplanecinus]